MVRHESNQLPNNLPQLQNCIKRDPESYKDEFHQQYEHICALLEVRRLDPSAPDKNLEELLMFMAQICHCYKEEMKNFPGELINLLRSHGNVLHADIRLALCRALILIRNKGLIALTDIIEPFFQLSSCQNKHLRSFLKAFLVNDIKTSNFKHRDVKTNSALQKFIFNILNNSKDSEVNVDSLHAPKMALDILIDLYKKGVWDDAKTVNAIASACFSKNSKVMVAGLTFFLGSDEDENKNDDSDSSDEEVVDPNSRKKAKETKMANKVNKKTRKRQRIAEQMEKRAAKKRKKEKIDPFNTKALHLIYNPEKMAEGLLAQLSDRKELKRIEIKFMLMNLISRLIGVHELYLTNFYPILQKYLQPKQREVTKILTYTAQACHEMIPADVLQPVLKTVVDNFISDRNSSECITVGLNTVREMCSRCPLIMEQDLLQDLIQYQKYKDKNVTMAARSLIQLFRILNPSFLPKKDRGRPKKKESTENDDGDDDNDGDDDEASEDDEEFELQNVDDSDEAGESEEEVDEEDDDEDDEEEDGEDEEDEEEETTEVDVKFGSEPKDIPVGQTDKGRVSKKRAVDEEEEDEEEEEELERPEIVSLKRIEKLYKRRKADKVSRLESVEKGREGREKVNPFAEKRQKERRRNKLFNMVKFKARAKNKRSFKEKQASLRHSLLKRMKRIK